MERRDLPSGFDECVEVPLRDGNDEPDFETMHVYAHQHKEGDRTASMNLVLGPSVLEICFMGYDGWRALADFAAEIADRLAETEDGLPEEN